MKKLFGIVMALVMMAAMTATVFADEGKGTEQEIEVNGYIGPGDYTDPDPEPDWEEIIVVDFDAKMYWWVDETDMANVQSTTNTIENRSVTDKGNNVTIAVSVGSFTAQDPAKNPAGLNLILKVGSKSYTNAQDGVSADPEVAVLANGATMDVEFGGTFTGSLPAEALTPKYDLVLNFAAKTVDKD